MSTQRRPSYRTITEQRPFVIESDTEHESTSRSVSFRAGPDGVGFRGGGWVFLVAGAFVTPLLGIALVLYLLPRVTGVEEMRMLREELAVTRKQNAELRLALDNVVARINRSDDETRNRFLVIEQQLRRAESK